MKNPIGNFPSGIVVDMSVDNHRRRSDRSDTFDVRSHKCSQNRYANIDKKQCDHDSPQNGLRKGIRIHIAGCRRGNKNINVSDYHSDNET